jgi:hypothetical protein
VDSKGVSYRFEHEFNAADDGGTDLILRGTIMPKGIISKLMCRVMGAGMIRKGIEKDLEQLRAVCEDEAQVSSA